MITAEQVAELAAKATPGPWDRDWTYADGSDARIEIIVAESGPVLDEYNAESCDVDLMAAAPDMAALIAQQAAELQALHADKVAFVCDRATGGARAWDLSPVDDPESAIRAKLIQMGWTPVKDTLMHRLQCKCVEMGVYWRASDDHGVTLTRDQAIDLLRDALGVDVSITP